MIPAELGALSPAEQRLWDAFPRGQEVILTHDRPHTVRAEVIRSVLLGAHPGEPGHGPALRLRGGKVIGCLDLHQTEVEPAIDLMSCAFDTAPRLSFARLRGVSFEGSTLPGLDAFAATVEGTLSFVKCTLTGALIAYGLHVSGDLDFDHAQLTAGHLLEELFGDRAAVFGDAIQVGRHLYLQGTIVRGDVELAGIRVGGSLYGQQGLRVEGQLRLRRADVAGEIALIDAVLSNPGETALDAWSMRGSQLTLLPQRVTGIADLRHAHVEVLRDDPDRWPAELRLDGLKYTALEPIDRADSRLPWLNRDPDGYRPQPYEQLAMVYRQIGHEQDARTVLLVKQRRRRRHLSRPGEAWSLLQDVLVGYGYRPGRAALWLLVLTAIGTTVFGYYPPSGGRGATAFNPLVYTLDMLIPIVNFGQKSAFGISGQAQWLAYLLTALGWLLFTAVAAALTRTFNRS